MNLEKKKRAGNFSRRSHHLSPSSSDEGEYDSSDDEMEGCDKEESEPEAAVGSASAMRQKLKPLSRYECEGLTFAARELPAEMKAVCWHASCPSHECTYVPSHKKGRQNRSCAHRRNKRLCVTCGGQDICEHDREKARCRVRHPLLPPFANATVSQTYFATLISKPL
jgi:hypothetical protein